MFETGKGIVSEWVLRPLSELGVLAVNVLHPVMMGCGRSRIYMVFKDNDI